ncbi:hypothetical protein DID88_000261 [Monilinia fructigena]|uniref:beta-glucosidase n=1 Tax=Monilinia fructigena TaxID=38457 RepID=A0A395IJW4_9HELO|nr:hypothetical protein DID88_000261 [Monilinia fructigena]
MAESPESQMSDSIFDKFREGTNVISSRNTVATPDSEISPPESPLEKHAIFDPRTKSRQLAKTLSLEEQVSLLVAADFWRSKSIPSKGIPAFKTSDGPNGARGAIFKAGTKAALFPCGISLAATWNTELIYEVGQHLADETKARAAQVLLAPTVCLHRAPLGGRNFESFSEDPFLTGKLAIAYIKGLQERGVAATIKHFVANEQETFRLTIDSVVQERHLRELYLRPFEMAIREANPWAVMSSYNLINGVHADCNFHTLREILRGEWNYDGLVMSDWGGTNSIVESIEAGCDIEMPVSTKWRGEKAIKAIENGKLSREAVENAAANVLYLAERTKGSDMTPESPEAEDDREETRKLIRQAGVEGITLLKNENNALPIKSSQAKIAVIGPNANRAIAGGGDVAIVIVGLDAEWESEGYDRQTMDLPSDGSQDRLIDAVVEANPNTIVVNQSGSPVTMPWVKKVPAILQAWYQGQEAGNALADVLFGLENPSGKLPTTFPVRLSDNPTYHTWPGENLRSIYGEGLYIGYRHYDHLSLPPLFPFGHGLSYTTFSYSPPTLSSSILSSESPNSNITLSLEIKNTGSMKGKEIVQLYIHDVKSRLVRPEKELKGFAKVSLEVGESKVVHIDIDKYSVGYWDDSYREGKGMWVAEEGEFKVLVGGSAADIRHAISFEIKGTFTWIF